MMLYRDRKVLLANGREENFQILMKEWDLGIKNYCFAIDAYHTFALASGVIVHNCGNKAVKTNLKVNEIDTAKIMDEVFHTIYFGVEKK